MTNQIAACPECDSSNVVKHGSPRGHRDVPEYGCKACGAAFDELVYREARSHQNSLGDSLAATLDAMDPDEVVP